MTDNELKNLLQSSTLSSKDERYNDADFTQRVISQLPNTEPTRVIWTIRIIAGIVALGVLFLTIDLGYYFTSFLTFIQSLSIYSWALTGSVIAALTLFLSRRLLN